METNKQNTNWGKEKPYKFWLPMKQRQFTKKNQPQYISTHTKIGNESRKSFNGRVITICMHKQLNITANIIQMDLRRRITTQTTQTLSITDRKRFTWGKRPDSNRTGGWRNDGKIKAVTPKSELFLTTRRPEGGSRLPSALSGGGRRITKVSQESKGSPSWSKPTKT